MKQVFLDTLCCLLRWSGLPLLIRETIARRQVTIINYHDPSPEVFAAHLAYFNNHYRLVSLDDVCSALHDKNFSRLPDKPLVITLDDGHRGNIKLLEIIEQGHVPVLIYAVAGVIGTNRHFWFKLQGFVAGQIKKLKDSNDQSRREILLKEFGYTDDAEQVEGQALSVDELKRLKNGGVSIGAHSMTHPMLTKCSSEVVLDEIVTSKRLLEELFGGKVRHFAYPAGDWNDEIKQMVKKTGYVSARTIHPGFVNPSSDLYALPNFGISDDASLNKAIIQASGIWSFVKCFIFRAAP